jgi:superfamily II DNA or RNA helicase
MHTVGVSEAWAWWRDGREAVRILGEQDLWGRRASQILRTSTGEIFVVPAEALSSAETRPWTSDELVWRASAARAIHLMAQGELAAAGRFALEPLPHQIRVVDRALSMEPVRLLLADEVGLGKTIEAGLIYAELKTRGRAQRVLVVAPKGVQLQWVAEMRDRFWEEFALVGPEGVPVDVGVDPWRAFDRVVCSLDAVKPLRRRAGWSPDRVAEHNERRFRALVEAGWDLVIFDEAHHVAGSTEGVARHELARELAQRAPNVLLLSATPHSGKTEAFARLLGLLDAAFLTGRPLAQDTVRPLVARTEKRRAVDAKGAPLFQPRTTSLEVVPYADRTLEQKLYSAVTDYVRHGYNRARVERSPALGFLVLLMQRLVSSSTAAILAALERRAGVLAQAGSQVQLGLEWAEEWETLTGEEQYQAFVAAQPGPWEDERQEVEHLVELARKTAASGIDAKAAHLLDLLRRTQRDEGDPAVKAVVFTEFIPTQEMLLDLLERVGIRATAINGSMSMEERALAQETFRESAQVLVSTDAGGEGINLQFAHVVVNYDLPWNPMRIEQRIGRVDRIGQRKPVRAFNLVMENSVDLRVVRVLEEKLWRILEELGADKWNDVLESAGRRVEKLYAEAIVNPERLVDRVTEVVQQTKEDILNTYELRRLLVDDGQPTREWSDTASRWLDRAAQAYRHVMGKHVAAETALGRLPESAPGESVPTIRGEVRGLWTLWEVRPHGSAQLRDCFALFVTETGSVRPDLAERIWFRLCDGSDVEHGSPLDPQTWADLHRLGMDYGYSSCANLAPVETWQVPWLVLRLVVRVER